MKTKVLFFKFWALTMISALLFTTSALAASVTLDAAFGVNGMAVTDLGGATDFASDVILQPDGKIILVGFAELNPNNARDITMTISRYSNNGVLDTTFGTDGSITPNTSAFSGSKVALQPDGMLVIAGTSSYKIAVVRYFANGILDNSFGVDGMGVISMSSDAYQFAADAAIQPDGKIVVVGQHTLTQSNYTDFIAARFNSDGTPDSTFVANGFNILDRYYFPNNRYNYGSAVAIQADGKIVISGNMMDNDGNSQISLIRLNPDGSSDAAGFGTNGKGTITEAAANFKNSAMILQAHGKILVAGDSGDINENITLARFDNSGALDITFGGTGIVLTDFGAKEYGADILQQADGKIILVGASDTAGVKSLLLARYNNDGSLDSSFGNSGKIITNDADFGAGVALQSDGKILVAGSVNGDESLLRYNMNISTVNIFKSGGVYDGWTLEYSEFKNTGGFFDRLATTFNLGDDGRDRQYKGILSFNTAPIPDTAVVTSAQLKIRRQGLVGTNPFTTHGNLYLNISNKAFSNNIALQITDFQAAASTGSTKDIITAETFDWYSANLSGTNLGFINKYGLTQLRLAFSKDDNDDLGADYMKFFSGNSIDANMPQLIISYYIP